MEKICWSDLLRYKDVLQRFKEERNIMQTIKRKKANWIGNISRGSCILRHVIKGNIEKRVEMKRRQQRRLKQLLDDFKERAVY
jgi:hypothetical protein